MSPAKSLSSILDKLRDYKDMLNKCILIILLFTIYRRASLELTGMKNVLDKQYLGLTIPTLLFSI